MIIPKTIDRFRVIFYDDKNNKLANNLSTQILALSNMPNPTACELIDENDDWLMYELDIGPQPAMISFLAEDDAENRAIRDIYDLMSNTNMTISIQILDGNDNNIETFTLTEVDVAETEMKDLTCASIDPQQRLITFTYHNAINSIKKL